MSKELEAVKKTTNTDGAVLLKPTGTADRAFHVLRRPHVSEKAARLTEAGTYVFDVRVDAEKIAIKKAVESLYKVHVVGIRTIRHAGKPVYRGRRAGARQTWKKALVTLKKGQKIDLYEGV
ncbi:50S ribosomal protein L23 [Candidatus Uhrbacteria bacterium]|nr:50S ribosomal protein L23 [Candidatus Uhrbacteria bacterium]